MTQKNEAPELLPCPFCGGSDLIEDRLGRIQCEKCHATAPYGYKVGEGWNTRADHALALVAEVYDDCWKQGKQAGRFAPDIPFDAQAALDRVRRGTRGGGRRFLSPLHLRQQSACWIGRDCKRHLTRCLSKW